MLSRGKILVKLAQQTITASAEHQHFTIQNSTITKESCINSEAISSPHDHAIAETNNNRLDEVNGDESPSETSRAVRDSDQIVDESYNVIVGRQEDTGVFAEVSDAEATDDADSDYVPPSNNEEEVETTLTATGKRKRGSSRSEHKKLRMQGKKYLGVGKNETGKMTLCVDREGRMLAPRTCTSRCQKGWGGRKCTHIDEDTRAEIFKTFWDAMTWGEKKVYIISLVEKKETKRKTSEGETSRRKYSYDFYLRCNNTKVKVCQSLFLSTFGLRNETVYRWVDERFKEHGIPKSPTAGQTRIGNRKDAAKEAAEQYLREIPKLPSHYCRSQSSKLYIETAHTNLRELYIDYKSLMEQDGKPVYGISQFTRMFNDKNLAFFKPKKDLCDTCCAFKAGTIQEEVYRQHIQRKEEAASAKALDKELAESDGKQKVITMDLQSLLLCPKIQASCLYYKTKLCCHNFTLYDLTSRDVLCYFWNETGADLNASTFVTCIVDYLEKLDKSGLERIVLYSDGCTYQNRNVTLANALLQFSVKHEIIIEQKFLERGHTYMECDSIHATIQRYIKNRDIFVPQQYVDAIQRSRKKPYEVEYVDHSFFKDYSKLLFYTSIRPGVGVGSPVVTDIRNLQYTPDGRILYKMNYSDQEYTELRKPRTQSSVYTDEVPPAYTRPLKLKKSKFQHLQQIKTVLPNDYHAYYDNLPHE